MIATPDEDISMDGAAPRRPCLLCGGVDCDTRARVGADRIWTALAEDFDAAFTEDERRRFAPDGGFDLKACRTCGLQFFDPAIPGDGDFYGRLSLGGRYYATDKWDFGAVLKHVAPGQRLVDVACGEGRFVACAKQAGVEAAGVDTNAVAVAAGRAGGLDLREQQLETFAEAHVGQFDVVTALQVIEHVPDPVAFTAAAAACVRPGGRLIVTVPNRDRAVKADFEPLDLPPHHLSLWSKRQLETLAQACGLTLTKVEMEPAGMGVCRGALRTAVAGRWSGSLWARALGFAVFNAVTYPVLKRLGLLTRTGFTGLSLLAVMERPAR